MTLRVAGLWRYPVKSLAGESLSVATRGVRRASRETASCTCAVPRAFARHAVTIGSWDCSGRWAPTGVHASTVIRGTARKPWH